MTVINSVFDDAHIHICMASLTVIKFVHVRKSLVEMLENNRAADDKGREKKAKKVVFPFFASREQGLTLYPFTFSFFLAFLSFDVCASMRV